MENKNLERETGVEPATSTLARSRSTTELLPLGVFDYKQVATLQQSRNCWSDDISNPVMLSGGESSLRELSAESKDPYLSTGAVLLRERTILKDWALTEVLRLRGCFAKRSSRSAQDDRYRTHERGRSRLHLHGLGGDAVADVPQIFVEEVFHALVQDFYRGAHGADDPSADDSLGQLEMVKAEEVNPLVEIEQALGYIVQAEEFLVPAIEVIYRQVELSQL